MSDQPPVAVSTIRRALPLVGLVLLIAVVASLGSATTGQRAIELLVYVAVAAGLSIFVSNTGILSFGHVSFMAVGAYAFALVSIAPGIKAALLPGLPGWLQSLQLPLPAAMAIGIVVAGAFAYAVSFPLSRLDGLAASIATLSLLVATNGVIANWDEVTGGTGSLPGVPVESSVWFFAAFAAVAVLVALVFEQSRTGLKLRATREDEPAARAAGIKIPHERRKAFLVSGCVVGAGGILYAQAVGVLSAKEFYLGITFLTIAMLVVGNLRSLTGAVSGAIVIYVLQELLRDLEQSGIAIGSLSLGGRPGMTEMLVALFMLLVLIARPEGLVSGGRSWRLRRRTPAGTTSDAHEVPATTDAAR